MGGGRLRLAVASCAPRRSSGSREQARPDEGAPPVRPGLIKSQAELSFRPGPTPSSGGLPSLARRCALGRRAAPQGCLKVKLRSHKWS
jgi:hypothetical protein